MACGDSYLDLVVTSGGRTLADPYGIPTLTAQGAYFEWYALAESLATQAHSRFVELGQVEEERGAGSFPKWNSLVELNNKMTEGFDRLTSPPISVSHDANIDEAIAVIKDALCLMERSDAAIWGYEHPGEPLPTAGISMWRVVLGTLAAVAVAGGAWYGVKQIRRARRRSRSENPAPRRRRRRPRSTAIARAA